jgi:aminopeptidase-like protein
MTFSQETVGDELYRLIERLYPICRSITGSGVRETLSILREYIDLEIHEVSSGTQVFDWQVPKEWNIRDAYIKDSMGNRRVDFRQSNLHVVGYSVPVNLRMPLSELREHLHTIPEHPEWIPYRTSYYREAWGFCLTHNQLDSLENGEYEVVIDSELRNGSLTYGEYYVRGDTADEVLIYSHICHPSLCNDNLSGVSIAVFLARYLAARLPRYSYRFVFAPATIGSITWLSQNESSLEKIKHGIVLATAGDQGKVTYKKSRYGNAEIDNAILHVLKHRKEDFDVMEFDPYGYDERQFCSPGINLPVGRLSRTPNGCYEEYHTSADNLDLVRPDCLGDTYSACVATISLLEGNATYLNTNPKCEPQLGRRGLYRKMGGHQDLGQAEYAMLWLLNLSDGTHSLLDIADHSNLGFDLIRNVANDLLECGLLRPAGQATTV